MGKQLPTQPAGRHVATVLPRHVFSCCRWVRPDAQSIVRVLALSLAVLAVANPTAVPAGIHETTHPFRPCEMHGQIPNNSPSFPAPASTNTHACANSEGLTCTLRVPHGSAESTASRPRCALVCAVRRLSLLGLPAVCTGCVLACAVQRLRGLHLLIQFVVWSFVVAFVVGLATLRGTPRYRRTRHAERRQGKAIYIVRPPTHAPTTKLQPHARLGRVALRPIHA